MTETIAGPRANDTTVCYKMKSLYIVLAVVLLCNMVAGDIYMHYPPGSNNRQAERNQNRQNANRLFDSQNNNRGGYNSQSSYYYVGSLLPVEVTMQHGFGTNPKMHSQIVLQYMCDTWNAGIRDGTETTRIPDNEEDSRDVEYGQHETYAYYQKCKSRERNYGLFTADQLDRDNKNSKNDARYTRQDNQGTRYGFECPEERDYYPYWQPTPWKDIAIFTSDVSRCAYYTNESQNVKPRFECNITEHNNEVACLADGGGWIEVPAWGIEAPQCYLAPFSRDNHLGNVVGGQPFTYMWPIPDDVADNCVIRARYNISTGETPWDASGRDNMNLTVEEYMLPNGEDGEKIATKIYLEDNPRVNFGIEGVDLQLALNTDQYGRTFQDRSHVFNIVPRPASVPITQTIYNLGVRGRRGNIVQVYPAVEYDFVPNTLEMTNQDYVHIQWSGSNNSPAGDGEGTENTDRSNMMQVEDLKRNWPEPLSEIDFENRLTLAEDRAMAYKYAMLKPQIGGDTATLDDAGTYFDGGLRHWHTGTGTINYLSTRNNNFSNRSQKGRIVLMQSNRMQVRVDVKCASFTRQMGEVWLKEFAEIINVPVERLRINQWWCGSVVMDIHATAPGNDPSGTTQLSTKQIMDQYQTTARLFPESLANIGVLNAVTPDDGDLTIRSVPQGTSMGTILGVVGAAVVLVAVAIVYVYQNPNILPSFGGSGSSEPAGDGNELSYFRKYGRLSDDEADADQNDEVEPMETSISIENSPRPLLSNQLPVASPAKPYRVPPPPLSPSTE